MQNTIDKAVLRNEIRRFRSSLSEEDWARRSSSICAHLLNSEILKTANWVHVFWPIHKNREVDLRPLIRDLQKSGKRIVLPVVDGSNLTHRLFTGEHNLLPGIFGQKEPQNEEVVLSSSIDVVIVPALALDKTGNRLGYGGGFYDRFLAHSNAIFISPVFSEQIVESLSPAEHDIAMDFIVSELGIIDISKV